MPYPSYPIIGVKGSARSGKDTIAGFLAEALGGQCVAMADPMKRFAGKVFDFTEDQLWGGTAKESIDPRSFGADTRDWFWAQCSRELSFQTQRFYEAWPETGVCATDFSLALREWFIALEKENYDRGISPRVVLQRLGTEFGRKLSKDMWSHHALNTAFRLLDGAKSYSRTEGLLAFEPEDGMPGWVLVTDLRFRNEALNIKRTGGWILEVVNPAATGPSEVGIKGHASETELATIPKTWNDIVFTNDKALGLEHAREQVQTMVKAIFKV